MYFYYFLYVLRRIQMIFLFLLRHLMFFNNKYHEIHKLVLLVSFVVPYCRPSRSSDLVPRLAVVGVVLLAILTNCQQPNKIL